MEKNCGGRRKRRFWLWLLLLGVAIGILFLCWFLFGRQSGSIGIVGGADGPTYIITDQGQSEISTKKGE